MCSQVLRGKDLLIKFSLQKHGQVKWDFSNLVPPHTFQYPSTPGQCVGRSRLVQKSLAVLPSSPTRLAPVGKQAVFCHLFCLRPRVVMVTGPSSSCYPQRPDCPPQTGSELRASCRSPCLQSPRILVGHLGNKVTLLRREEFYNPVISLWLRGEGVYEFLGKIFLYLSN